MATHFPLLPAISKSGVTMQRKANHIPTSNRPSFGGAERAWAAPAVGIDMIGRLYGVAASVALLALLSLVITG